MASPGATEGHSGFHVHDGVGVAEGDLEFAKRPARYRARKPVALDRLEYVGPSAPVHARSDKRDGPTPGTETVDPPLCPACGGAWPDRMALTIG